MSMAHVTDSVAPPRGGCSFLSPSARSVRCRELAAEGYLMARVVPVVDDEGEDLDSRPSWHGGPLRRGGLREAIEGAVEICLALRGAVPPAVEIDAPLAAMAHDQIFRVRALGATGLCLVLPPLAKLALGRLLDAADSEVLRTWHELSASESVQILFDAGDRELEILAPRPLGEVFPAARARWCDDARALDGVLEALQGEGRDDEADDDGPWSAIVESPEAGEPDLLSERWPGGVTGAYAEPPQAAESAAQRLAGGDDTEDEREASDDLEEDGDLHEASNLEEDGDDFEDDDFRDDDETRDAGMADDEDEDEDEDDEDLDEDDEAMEEPPPTVPRRLPDNRAARVMTADPLAGIDDIEAEAAPFYQAAPEIAEPSVEPAAKPITAPAPATKPPPAPVLRLRPEQVAAHCEALEHARGPRPVKAIEELFRTHYVPLVDAICCGLEDGRAFDAVDEWSESFERSYVEGFSTMKVTGRRPTMVLDAPEVATRIAKLNGARAVQLLLVDAMRYDLGQRVQAELKVRLSSQAVCVDETIMWSALPTITPVQMRLLGRGAAGLREAEALSEREPSIQRDGSLTTLRRVRIGRRDLVKLDLVEARLRDAGPGYVPRIESLAREVSDVIASYAESLPPRTLLFVFGDHGYDLPLEGQNATGAAIQGGATPEEVLLGGWSWLMGDSH
ncbi:MAG: hypothetical protein R3B72_02555 [Polyangiaceae bacterium]